MNRYQTVPASLIVPAAILIIVILSGTLFAQEEDNDDLQLWNDIELTVPLNKRLEANFDGTLRLEENISKVESYRFTAGVTYTPHKSLSFAPFTTFISSRSSTGSYRYEYRSGIKIDYRLPVETVSIRLRNRFEHRSRPGRNSWRYRPSVTVKKKLPERFIKDADVYVTEEPFYDSVSGRFSRNRLYFGVEKKVNKKFSIDLYYLFQGDNASAPGSVHVLGANWKISL